MFKIKVPLIVFHKVKYVFVPARNVYNFAERNQF